MKLSIRDDGVSLKISSQFNDKDILGKCLVENSGEDDIRLGMMRRWAQQSWNAKQGGGKEGNYNWNGGHQQRPFQIVPCLTGLTLYLWSNALKKVSERCNGWFEIEEETELKNHLRWAHVRVKGPLKTIPATVDIANRNLIFLLPIWLEAPIRSDVCSGIVQFMLAMLRNRFQRDGGVLRCRSYVYAYKNGRIGTGHEKCRSTKIPVLRKKKSKIVWSGRSENNKVYMNKAQLGGPDQNSDNETETQKSTY
ncbi:hypothetical protein H5410_026993 [Solanum commersonii]|uniref:DUF4283 domain-containing protein n=1 Tax=Solanum commersonii TaxID=4109 RepID=A0A9J5Z022_SOLCO|nr:hypothetical protein H5410_026993 [Solanum commersonii]